MKQYISSALRESFVKLRPASMFRNPVMFTVYLCTIIMLFVCIWIMGGEHTQGSLTYNIAIFFILFITVLFANFAEAVAEARGKAQANSLRKTREDTPAKKVFAVGEIYVGEIRIVPSSQLHKGDVFIAETGDILPMDGEIIE